MTNRAHARRRSQGFVPAAVGGVAGACVALTLLPAPLAFAQVGDAVPAQVAAPAPSPPSPADVGIGEAIQVSRDNPVPHPPSAPVPVVLTGRPVAKTPSPCTIKATQAKATTDAIRSAYRTPKAYELAEDAGTIAQALYAECGWDR